MSREIGTKGLLPHIIAIEGYASLVSQFFLHQLKHVILSKSPSKNACHFQNCAEDAGQKSFHSDHSNCRHLRSKRKENTVIRLLFDQVAEKSQFLALIRLESLCF